jgi:hypothetical protein
MFGQYLALDLSHTPNSKLSILIYRNVLSDTTPLNILNTIERNG